MIWVISVIRVIIKVIIVMRVIWVMRVSAAGLLSVYPENFAQNFIFGDIEKYFSFLLNVPCFWDLAE